MIDGGVSDFQPLSESLPRSTTVTVSPFYTSHADIRPSRYVPLWWAIYPPRREDFEWVFALGYDDANTWLASLGQKDAIKTAQKINKKSAMKTDSLNIQEKERIRTSNENLNERHWWSMSDLQTSVRDISRFPSDASRGKWTFDGVPALIRAGQRSDPNDEIQLSRGSSRTSSACTSANTSATITPNSPLWFGDSHPTMSYQSIWPYNGSREEKHDLDTQPRQYSEYSFRRVFGYRSVLNIIPSGALDMFLVMAVYLVFQPFAFTLVYIELLIRIVVLTMEAGWHTGVSLVLSSKQASRKVWDGFIEPVKLLYNLFKDEFSVMQRRWRPMSTQEAEKEAYAIADAAARRAVESARQRASAKRARRVRRDSKRRLRATIRAVLNPVLMLRMVPLLGKYITGDAYALRRSLCELSVVYRVCVHFL